MTDFYRVYARLNPDNKDHAKIIEKVKNRNRAVHPSVNDYVLHALEKYDEEGEKALLCQIKETIKETIQGEFTRSEYTETGCSLLSELQK